MKTQSVIGGYLVLQAVGVACWWGMMWVWPGTAEWFKPGDWPREALWSFWVADGVMLVGGSVATAAAVWRGWGWATNAIWALAAASAYPTLYCLGVSVTTGQAWVATALMTTMAGLTLSMATIQGHAAQEPDMYRAVRMGTGRALGWASLQIVVFWLTFFLIMPMGILEVASAAGLGRFDHAGQGVLSAVVFVLAGTLGLSSAVWMARLGRGTPLPTATGSELMVGGPYRWIRNPMATAGITQGVAVGWWLGSFAVMAYAVAGGVLWHVVVRPSEEADLVKRFGASYEAYRQKVGLWVPKWRRGG